MAAYNVLKLAPLNPILLRVGEVTGDGVYAAYEGGGAVSAMVSDADSARRHEGREDTKRGCGEATSEALEWGSL